AIDPARQHEKPQYVRRADAAIFPKPGGCKLARPHPRDGHPDPDAIAGAGSFSKAANRDAKNGFENGQADVRDEAGWGISGCNLKESFASKCVPEILMLAQALPSVWLVVLSGYLILAVPITFVAALLSLGVTYSVVRIQRKVRCFIVLIFAVRLVNGAFIFLLRIPHKKPALQNKTLQV